ncbi:hypothetical protein FMJ22_13395 [Klebsiella michiganensis]|uniref:phage adaptor protein n=1 Tax=Klebsiella michiganensis TaxID=1134687 RepID=UPI001CC96BE0|nr:hypothetical protein [Klebsiella michiganensis]MBZ7392390.1 hypothetical protein [Klebsiella michiganensis]
MSTTYDALTAKIKSWCKRTDSQTISAIPDFIDAAQTALNSELRIGDMIASVSFNTDSTSVDISEFLEASSVTIGGLVGTSTTFAEITALRLLVDQRPETKGYDFHYAMNGNSIELVKPNAVIVTGYQKPTPISSANQTNSYTDSAANALTWLCLHYCAAFCKDSNAAQSWFTLAESEIANLNNARDKFVKTGTAEVRRRGYF